MARRPRVGKESEVKTGEFIVLDPNDIWRANYGIGNSESAAIAVAQDLASDYEQPMVVVKIIRTVNPPRKRGEK
jgi:hypothetical protein